MKKFILFFIHPDKRWWGTKEQWLEEYYLEDLLLIEIFDKYHYLKPSYWAKKLISKIISRGTDSATQGPNERIF